MHEAKVGLAFPGADLATGQAAIAAFLGKQQAADTVGAKVKLPGTHRKKLLLDIKKDRV